jgi:hypothetical protein
MAFLAPAFALAGEAVATFAVETVAPAAFDAACSLGDAIFGWGEQAFEPLQQLTEEEAEIANVNTRSYFGGASDEETDALLDNHLSTNHPEADDHLVQLAEHGASDETPGIQQTLTRLRDDPEFRNEMLKKAAYTAIASGAAVGTEQLAVHAYAYAINQNPPSEILTHHEHITGSLPNNPHIDPIYSPAYSPASDYMAPRKKARTGSKAKKRTMYNSLGYPLSGYDAEAKRSRLSGTTQRFGSTRLSTSSVRHYYPVSFNNYTLGTDRSRVMPLLHQWSGTEDTANITLGVKRGTGPTERIGDIITLKKIELTIAVRYSSPTYTPCEKFNFYLVYDNDYDRSWPTPTTTDWKATNFFQEGGLRTDSVRTRNGLNRFTVLKKVSVDFSQYNTPITTGSSGISGTLYVPNYFKSVKLTCNTTKPIMYDSADDAGAYNLIRHGQLYLVGCGTTTSQPTPELYVQGNIEFLP